jgi:hypothetical protein
MNNDHLIPDLIHDIVKRYKAARLQNEKFLLEDRLRVIVAYIQDALDGRSNIFKKVK